MSAKKSDFGLIIKLLVALAIGAFLGRMANVEVMDAVASVKYALGQIIFYAVPLVIVGFITPAIARLGQNASKMLLTAVAIAYLSSVGAAAAMMSMSTAAARTRPCWWSVWLPETSVRPGTENSAVSRSP